MSSRRRDSSRDTYRRRDHRDREGSRDSRRDRYDPRDDRQDRNRDRDWDRRRGGRDKYRVDDRRDDLDRDRKSRRNRERENREHERESRNRDRERHSRWDVQERSSATKRHKREFSDDDEENEEEKKDAPNYESGVLSKSIPSNSDVPSSVEVRDITYTEPVDAAEPPQSNPFHLFLFEPGQEDPTDKMQLDKRSYYRFGRDSQLNDALLRDISCSKVHAALQFRKIETVNDDGETSYLTSLYVIDLDSTNGTFINDKQIPTSRYVQVLPKDVLSFGDLSTDFVVVRHDDA